MNTRVCLLFIFSFFLLGSVSGAKSDRVFKIAGIGPWSKPYGDFLSFARFAAQLLNNNTGIYQDLLANTSIANILPDITLEVDVYDVGQTDPGLASVSAVKASETSNFLAYMGGVRTSQQQEIVYVADNLQIPYVGGIVSGATFSDKTKWPFFSRTSLTDQFMSFVMVRFAAEILNITNVALVYQDDDFGIGNYNAFLTYAEHYNINVTAFEVKSLGTDFGAQANQLKSASNRIIVLMTEYAEGLVFLQNASSIGLVGPNYLWLFSQAWSQGFARSVHPPEVLAMVQGSILFKPNADLTNFSSILQNLYNASEWGDTTNTKGVIDTVSWYLADALFTIAQAFDKYIKDGGNTTKINGTALHNAMCAQQFEGVSGLVVFDGNCDRRGTYLVLNYQHNATNLTKIQTFSPFVNTNEGGAFSAPFSTIYYYDGTTNRPRDLPCYCQHGACEGYSQTCKCDAGWIGDICQDKDHSVPLGIALGVIVGLSIIISIFAFLILMFRKYSFAEKSPLFCGIIIIGTVFAYIGALTLLPEPTDNLCMSFPWMVGIGFTFVFGCLFLKTWRVYHIIDNSMKMEKVKITNFYIIRLIGIALLVEVIFMIVWTTKHPMKVRAHKYDGGSYSLQCFGDHQEVYWAVFAGYKLCWMIFGAVMAVKTRYYYDEYNDSKAIAMSIYNAIATMAIGVPIAVVLRNFEYVVLVIEVAIVVIMFNFTLISIFFNTWMVIFFGEAIELPDLKPQNSSGTSRGTKSNSNEKSSMGSSNGDSRKASLEVYVA